MTTRAASGRCGLTGSYSSRALRLSSLPRASSIPALSSHPCLSSSLPTFLFWQVMDDILQLFAAEGGPSAAKEINRIIPLFTTTVRPTRR